MSSTSRRLTWIGSVVALTIAVQFLHGSPPAKAVPPSTTATTSSPTSSTARTAPSPASPDCKDVLDGDEPGVFGKAVVGGDAGEGFQLFRIETGRPDGVYHVVDCFSTPPVFAAVDLGDIRISGTATLRVDLPSSAQPGEEICDRFVMSGIADGEPFTDVSNQVCQVFNSCLFISSPCPRGPTPTTAVVASTTPRRGALPFTGAHTWPLLITAGTLLGLGAASLLVACRRHDRPTP
jgi:hypothetical protein